jgi:TPR repeat protein
MVEIVAEAEQGNKKAQFVLAKMYEYGYGMVKNT